MPNPLGDNGTYGHHLGKSSAMNATIELPDIDLLKLVDEADVSFKPTVDRDQINEELADRVSSRRSSATIMLVDDEAINVKVAKKYLEQFGYENFIINTDPLESLNLIRQHRPDLILLDVMMPHISGIEILNTVRREKELAGIPVIILTAAVDRETRLEVLKAGATDFLTKPVDPAELQPRVENVLNAKAYHDHLVNYADELEKEVQARTRELVDSREEVIHCLARAAEFRDDDTGQHVIRVGRYTGLIASELGFDRRAVQLIEQAAQLHDVGKIGIPDEILLKPGKLTREEFEAMQRHAAYGKNIIDKLPQSTDHSPYDHAQIGLRILESRHSPILKLAGRIALTHHERWDGSGYPLGLAGTDIPLEGRITAVADVFDALSTKRPYKLPFPIQKCFEILEDGRGSHFDPEVLDAFFRCRDEVVQIQIEFADA